MAPTKPGFELVARRKVSLWRQFMREICLDRIFGTCREDRSYRRNSSTAAHPDPGISDNDALRRISSGDGVMEEQATNQILLEEPSLVL